MARDHGEFILQRISTIAQSAGAPLGPQECKPNLFVLVTAEPARLVNKLWSRNPGMLAGMAGAGPQPAAIRRFMRDTRPIRAWYTTGFRGAAGNALGVVDMPQGGAAGKQGMTAASHAVLANTFSEGSRLTWDDVQDITSALVVVDARRIDGLKMGAMADYIAMLGLTKINLDADFSGDNSILRLFSAAEQASTMTQLSAWDAAFLKAVYHTSQSNRMQRSLIVTRMMQDVAP